jgi:hypothetical protein
MSKKFIEQEDQMKRQIAELAIIIKDLENIKDVNKLNKLTNLYFKNSQTGKNMIAKDKNCL